METIEKRNIAVSVLLAIITLGIYGIIWFVKVANDIRTLQPNSGVKAGKDLLLSIISFGFYYIYLMYKYPKAIVKAEMERGMKDNDFSTLSIILTVLGLNIIPWCMIQAELNKFANEHSN